MLCQVSLSERGMGRWHTEEKAGVVRQVETGAMGPEAKEEQQPAEAGRG